MSADFFWLELSWIRENFIQHGVGVWALNLNERGLGLQQQVTALNFFLVNNDYLCVLIMCRSLSLVITGC